MAPTQSILKPTLELTFAAILWGFGFVANVWCLTALSPSAIVFYRFTISGLLGLALFPLLRITRPQMKQEFKISIFAGVALGLCLFLQTWGLQYTTATNSGFITTLYVVIVPFVAWGFLKESLSWLHWVCVFLALLGTLLVVQLESIDLNKGDALTFACAFVASIQIVYISQISDRSKSPFIFNTFQSLWAGVPYALALMKTGEISHWNLGAMDTRGWIGFFSLTFCSTSLAFYLQIRAQKHLSSSHASLLYLLESPFSYVFAYFLLNERMSVLQMFGAFLILASCVLATRAASHAGPQTQNQS